MTTPLVSNGVKSAEIPAFPVDKFLAAGIPREATVELWVSGGHWVYGEIKDPRQIGGWPVQAELMDIAYEDQCSEVRCVEVECKYGGMEVAQTLKFEFKGGAAKEFLLMESHRHPIAARGVWFNCGRVVEPAKLRVADLAFVTYQKGHLWLEGEAFEWEDEDFDGYPDYEVMVNGDRFSPEQFWCTYGGK